MITVYNAVNDFRTSSNNGGPWTYGYSEAGDAGYRMIRFDNTTDRPSSGIPGVVWSKNGYVTSGTPSIWRNLDTFPRYGVAPGQVSLHPGPRPNGDFTILRFTAPAVGRYKVAGQFFAGDSGAMSGRILRNERFASPLVSFPTTTDNSTFDLPVLDLDAGERLDFVVGNNGNFSSGNTPLVLSIEADTASPVATVFDAVAAFQISSNDSGVWRYGYSSDAGANYAFIAFDSSTDNQARVNPGISWSKRGYNNAGAPTAWKNQATTQRYGVPPEALSLHPGPRPNGDCAIMRFVAPRTARYAVTGRFSAGDSGRMDGSVVLDGKATAPLRYFPECTDNSSFDLGVLALSIGQTMDFVVGNKGNYSAGNTPVAVRIEALAGNWSAGDLNNYVDAFGRMAPVASGTADVGSPTVRDVDAAGVAYRVTEQKRRAVKEVIDHSYLSDIAAMGVWPGQIVQSEGMLRASINAIGPFLRLPGRVEIVTELVSPTPGPQFRDVAAPDAGSVNDARRNILNAIKPTDSAGTLKGDFESASSLREVGLKLGLTVTGSAFGVDANAQLNETYKKSVVVGVIRQVFYSVNFTPAAASAAGFWDPAKTTAADLGRFMRNGNPPLYVNSVQFGRLICVTAEGAHSSVDMQAALKAHYDSSVKVAGSIDAKTKKLLGSLRVSIYTMGVPGHLGFETITDPVTELDKVYKAGKTFDWQNPGMPVSFTCLHLADGSSAHVQVAAEYVVALSAVGADIQNSTSYVFDGPGGGLKDTGIIVNPADQVTIQADGMIANGVIFSTNGPEGWPGHTADPAAPLAGGTAYCLIHKFSKDSDWQETKRFWEGSSKNGGRLLLNNNDNNPYNGDPTKQWRVVVDVKRGNAGATGIYI